MPKLDYHGVLNIHAPNMFHQIYQEKSQTLLDFQDRNVLMSDFVSFQPLPFPRSIVVNRRVDRRTDKHYVDKKDKQKRILSGGETQTDRQTDRHTDR